MIDSGKIKITNDGKVIMQFILPNCIKYNIPVEQDGKLIKVGK